MRSSFSSQVRIEELIRDITEKNQEQHGVVQEARMKVREMY